MHYVIVIILGQSVQNCQTVSKLCKYNYDLVQPMKRLKVTSSMYSETLDSLVCSKQSNRKCAKGLCACVECFKGRKEVWALFF